MLGHISRRRKATRVDVGITRSHALNLGQERWKLLRQRLNFGVAGTAGRSGWTSHAVDLDLSLVDVNLPNLGVAQADIMPASGAGSFDLITARAVLHHIADAEKAIANLVPSLRLEAP